MNAAHTRRDFLTKSALAGMATLAVPLTVCAFQAGHLNDRYKDYYNIK